MKEDRFLVVILVVIGLLVVISLSIFFVRQDSAVYLPEDRPENIIHNFLLAIHNDDYERAYAYLAEKENKPSYEDFEQNYLFYHNDVGYQIGETDISKNTAYVEITIMNSSSDFFFDRYNYVENARLVKEEGEWKVIQMPYSYWSWEWYQEKE